MAYPEFIKGESTCAKCDKVIGEDGEHSSYLTVRENNLIVNFFQFENGEDNIFCDEYCLAEFLFAEKVYLKEDQT